jgi:hypothetical protein
MRTGRDPALRAGGSVAQVESFLFHLVTDPAKLRFFASNHSHDRHHRWSTARSKNMRNYADEILFIETARTKRCAPRNIDSRF